MTRGRSKDDHRIEFSEVIYTEDEVEFMMAMHEYKRYYRRPWPTEAEMLAVLKVLGYRKTQGTYA